MPDSLQAKLAAARLRWRSFQVAGGVAASFTVLTALVLLSFHSDRLFVLGTSGRQGWLIALLAGAVVAAAVFLVRPLLRPIPDQTIASAVERRFPALQERLLTTVELAQAPAGAGVSGAMVAQLARETERLAAPLSFPRAVPAAPFLRPAACAWGAGALLLGHVLVVPDAMAVWLRRILSPSADILIYSHTRVRALPGDRVVPRGEDVVIGVQAGGRLPQSATLHYRVPGSKWTRVELTNGQTLGTGGDTARKFSFRVNDAQQDISYYATAGDGRSNPHTLRVEDRPTVLGVRLHLTYPAYTGRPAQTIAATAGNIVAPVGTRVEVTATANKPLGQALLVEDGQTRGPWEVRGETARGRLLVARDQTYGLRLRDTRGFDAAQTPQYTVRAQPDRTPLVQIVRPGADLERTPGGRVDLRVTASDDYGVQETRLAYRSGRRSGSLPLPGAGGRTRLTTGGTWNLATLPLKAGDTIAYEALARDGGAPRAQTGRSATYRIHILSVGEMRDRLEARVREEQEALRQLIRRQEEAQSLLTQARRAPARAALSAARTAERGVAQEAADLARRMQQTTEQMRDNNLGTAPEQARRAGAQQSLQQLAQTSIPAAADTIERAETAGASQSPPLLADAARREQAVRQELERLARQVGRAPTASELAREAGRLAQEQQRLAEQAELAQARTGGKTPARMSAQERAQLGAQARQQADLRARTEALEQQVRQAVRDAQERGQPDAAELGRAGQQMQKAAVPQQQAAAQRSLQSGQPSEASPQQNEAARGLQDLANRLAQAASNQPDAQQRAAQLEQLADRLQKMAREQDAIRQQNKEAARRAEEGQPVDPGTGKNLAQQEQNLRAAAQETAPRLPDVPRAQRALQRAGENLGQTASRLNQSALRDALEPSLEAQRELEEAAREARDAAAALQQQAAVSQAQQAVEQLAREQRALRQQTQQLENARKNGEMTPAQQQRAQNLAQQEAGLSQRGQDLAGKMPSPAFAWAMGEAKRRMEGAAGGLRQQNTGQATQRQQEQAAQTLERIARALGQQAQAGAPPGASGSEQQAAAQSQMAAAAGELQLAREMEAQIRQETTSLDQRRSRNPSTGISPEQAEQQRELQSLNQAQRETENIARSAARQLRALPQVSANVERAAEQMQGVQDMLQQQQTGAPTQQKEGEIVRLLDQALNQAQQAMAQQRQQMMAQGQQPGQQPGQAGQQPGGNPRSRNPIDPLKDGAFRQESLRGRGFGGLDPRGQRALRAGQGERVPAEYRDLVNQYYKALGQRR